MLESSSQGRMVEDDMATGDRSPERRGSEIELTTFRVLPILIAPVPFYIGVHPTTFDGFDY